jgi:7-cyano-7-deazaguanine synthase
MKVLLILSGGMDSATLLYELLSYGHQVECIGVNYSQRHSKELGCAAQLCKDLDVKFEIIDLSSMAPFLSGSSQSDPTVDVPFGRYDEPSMKKTVVPNRNMLMLAAAGSAAIARGFDAIAYGAHAGDHTIYPDCRGEFVDVMSDAFMLCDWSPLKLLAPYLELSKGQIAKHGLALGVPYEKTWTCYVGLDKPCGQCGACVERAEAFEYAGKPDPLLSRE